MLVMLPEERRTGPLGESKDFSCSDRMFAANIGIGMGLFKYIYYFHSAEVNRPHGMSCSPLFGNISDFKTPEEFFLGEKPAPFEWRAVDPSEVLKNAGKTDDESSCHSDVS